MCGSDDNVVVYYNSDLGAETFKCMTPNCTHMKTDDDLARELGKDTHHFELPAYNTPRDVRGISVKTQQLYSVGVTDDALILPYFKEGKAVCYKRYAKKLLPNGKKDMKFVGDASNAPLFGSQTVGSGRKYLIITEGEIDAMSAYQMTGICSVSIPNGADGALKTVKNNLKWLESFQKVILCFDSDSAGQDATDEVFDFLRAGIVHRATMRLKDANEYLQADLGKEFKELINNASQKPVSSLYTSEEVKDLVDDIINGNAEIHKGIDVGISPLDRFFRLRDEETTTVFADPGVGKSSFCRQIVANLIRQRIPVLMFCLEESDTTYVSKTLNMYYNKRLTSNDLQELREDIHENFTRYLHLAKVSDSDTTKITEAVEHAVRVHGVRVVLFDNVTAATASSGDIVAKIGEIYMVLNSLGKQWKHHTIIVSHTKRQPKKLKKSYDDEDDGVYVPFLCDGYGSGGIERFSYNVIALGRKDDENLVSVALRKQRTTGDLGYEFFITWDTKTHSFKESSSHANTQTTTGTKESSSGLNQESNTTEGRSGTERDGSGLILGTGLLGDVPTDNSTTTIQETTRDIHSDDNQELQSRLHDTVREREHLCRSQRETRLQVTGDTTKLDRIRESITHIGG